MQYGPFGRLGLSRSIGPIISIKKAPMAIIRHWGPLLLEYMVPPFPRLEIFILAHLLFPPGDFINNRDYDQRQQRGGE